MIDKILGALLIICAIAFIDARACDFPNAQLYKIQSAVGQGTAFIHEGRTFTARHVVWPLGVGNISGNEVVFDLDVHRDLAEGAQGSLKRPEFGTVEYNDVLYMKGFPGGDFTKVQGVVSDWFGSHVVHLNGVHSQPGISGAVAYKCDGDKPVVVGAVTHEFSDLESNESGLAVTTFKPFDPYSFYLQ